MISTKNYRATAEVLIEGINPTIEHEMTLPLHSTEESVSTMQKSLKQRSDADTLEIEMPGYEENYSSEALFLNTNQSRTPSPTQVVQAVPSSQLRCFGCGRTIDDIPSITVLNGIFHDNCFRCDACKTLLNVTNYHVVDGKPHCNPPCEMQLSSKLLIATTIKKSPSVSESIIPERGDHVYQTVIVSKSEDRKEIQKEYCSVCTKVIDSNMFVRALDGIFHNYCFRCHHCNRLLRVGNCKFIDSKLHCDPDCVQAAMESPPLTERSTTVGPLGERTEKTIPSSRYHFTMESKRPNSPQIFQVNAAEQMVIDTIGQSKIEFARSLVEPTCYVCQGVVSAAERLDTMNRVYHRMCFRCHKCNRLLHEHKYNIEEEKPCCQPYCGYDEVHASHPIYVAPTSESVPISIMYQDTTVKSDISPVRMRNTMSASLPERNDTLYLYQGEIPSTENEWKTQQRSTSQPESVCCFQCSKKVYALERINALNRVYHRTCFRCNACKNVLNIGRFGVYEGKPYCEPHQKQLTNLRSSSAHNLIGDEFDEKFDKPFTEGTMEYLPVTQPIEPTQAPPTTESSVNNIEEQMPVSMLSFTKTFPRGVITDGPVEVKHTQVLVRSQTNSHAATPIHSEEMEMNQPPEMPQTPGSYTPSTMDHLSERMKYINPSQISVEEGYCYVCGKKVYHAERLFILDRLYHRSCFRCLACNSVLNIGRYSVHEDQPYCIPHHRQLMHLSTGSLHTLKSETPREEFNEAYEETATPVEPVSDKTSASMKAKSEPNTPVVLRRPVISQSLAQQPHNVLKAPSLMVHRAMAQPLITRQNTTHASTAEQEAIPVRPHTPVTPVTPVAQPLIHQQPQPQSQHHPQPQPQYHHHHQQQQEQQPPRNEEPIPPSPVVTYRNPLGVLTKSLYERSLDHRSCSRCQVPIGMEDRIALSNRVLHARCAECKVCRLNLSPLSFKELNGQLYCSVHFAQELAAMQQSKRNSLSSTPGTPRPFSIPPGRKPATPVRNGPPQLITHRPAMPAINKVTSFVSDETVNTLRQVAAHNPPQPQQIMLHTQQNTPVQPQRVHLQAQHEQLVEKLNLLNGDSVPDALVCVNCHQSVQPSMFLQLGAKRYHFGCIRCQICEARLNRWNYKEIDGTIYCSKHFNLHGVMDDKTKRTSTLPSRSSTPRRMSVDKTLCFVCEDNVYAPEQLNVLDRVYHRTCFKCVRCHNTLGVENYYVHDGAPYCKAHYIEASHYAPAINDAKNEIVLAEREQNPCHMCQQPVHPRDGMHVLERFYHYGCFKCTDCQEVLNMGKFEVAQGQPYCEVDFLKNFGKNRPISTRAPPQRFAAVVQE